MHYYLPCYLYPSFVRPYEADDREVRKLMKKSTTLSLSLPSYFPHIVTNLSWYQDSILQAKLTIVVGCPLKGGE